MKKVKKKVDKFGKIYDDVRDKIGAILEDYVPKNDSKEQEDRYFWSQQAAMDEIVASFFYGEECREFLHEMIDDKVNDLIEFEKEDAAEEAKKN